AAAYLKSLDKDGDEQLSKQEAKNTEWERYFGQADQQDPETKQGDEQLTAAEIEQHLARRQTGRDGVVTAKELEDFYVRNRVNGDGQLSRDELKSMFGGYRNGMGDGPRGTP